VGSGGEYTDRVKLRGKSKTRFQVSGVRQGINFNFKYQIRINPKFQAPNPK
jgi:hypothetical protein